MTTRSRTIDREAVHTTAYTVLIDAREKAPFKFTGLATDSPTKYVPLAVRWQYAHLPTGDYSIQGFTDRLCIERKSLEDLYSTLGSHRERFEAEHERMTQITATIGPAGQRGYAAVVIEADWHTILAAPPPQSRLLPKSVYRTALAWSQRYGVQWWAVGNRRLAEITTFRMLDRWWQDWCQAQRSQNQPQPVGDSAHGH